VAGGQGEKLHQGSPLSGAATLGPVGSELPNNPGGLVTNSAEVIAADLLKAHKLPAPLMCIEHWRKDSTGGGAETFELVVFLSYEVEERAIPKEGRRGPGSGRWLEATGPRSCGRLDGSKDVGQASFRVRQALLGGTMPMEDRTAGECGRRKGCESCIARAATT